MYNDNLTRGAPMNLGAPNAPAVDPDMTAYSASGGCSCKLPALELDQIINDAPASPANYDGDDAAFTTLPSGEVLVTSIDFQNPIVADPRLAGEIGALNALSDIFACGVQPRWAEVVLALPALESDDQVAVGRRLMDGIRHACASAGCEITGGHTVVLPTPLVGLAVRGLAPPHEIKRKSAAQAGDVIVLTKPIGLGVAVAARQAGFLGDAAWTAALSLLRSPNSVGRALGRLPGVHGLTDITGFGLAGHSVEVARASKVTVEIELGRVPFLAGAMRAAAAGHSPLLAQSNWAFANPWIDGADALTAGEQLLLADPQTNGGLLITASVDALEDVVSACLAAGDQPAIIGTITEYDGDACRVKRT